MSADAGHVLVLDDDVDMQDLVTAMLQASTGHAVVTVSSISGAWSALGREPFDVVIADHDLGGEAGTGVEFLEELAARRADVGRILLTGWVDDPQVQRLAMRAKDDGLTLVLYKPISEAELVPWVGSGIAMARLARARARFVGS